MAQKNCENLPDYEEVRHKNNQQINDFYNKLLNGYTGLDGNEQERKDTDMLIELSQKMANKLKDSTKVILDLHKQHENKSKLVNSNRQFIIKMKHDIKSAKNNNSGSQQSYENLESKKKKEKNVTTFYFIINIIFGLVVIGMIVYIMFMKDKKNKNKINNLNSINKN